MPIADFRFSEFDIPTRILDCRLTNADCRSSNFQFRFSNFRVSRPAIKFPIADFRMSIFEFQISDRRLPTPDCQLPSPLPCPLFPVPCSLLFLRRRFFPAYFSSQWAITRFSSDAIRARVIRALFPFIAFAAVAAVPPLGSSPSGVGAGLGPPFLWATQGSPLLWRRCPSS